MNYGTVYRIQSKQDRTCGAYCYTPLLYTMHRPDQPTPLDDVGIKREAKRREEFCGCASAVSLLRWFRGFIPDLLRAGYEIVALHDVTITAVGEYQVLFKWND